MRIAPLLATLLAAAPAFGQSPEGALALSGLEGVARSVCGHWTATHDPAGLAIALEGPLGAAMGFENSDSIIGIIYDGDPQAGAQMWASTLTGRGDGCDVLVGILTRPVADTLADID